MFLPYIAIRICRHSFPFLIQQPDPLISLFLPIIISTPLVIIVVAVATFRIVTYCVGYLVQKSPLTFLFIFCIYIYIYLWVTFFSNIIYTRFYRRNVPFLLNAFRSSHHVWFRRVRLSFEIMRPKCGWTVTLCSGKKGTRGHVVLLLLFF